MLPQLRFLQRVGGIDARVRALEGAGFDHVECTWRGPRTAVLKADLYGL